MTSRKMVIASCTPWTVVSRSLLMSLIITFMFEPAKLQMNCASANGSSTRRRSLADRVVVAGVATAPLRHGSSRATPSASGDSSPRAARQSLGMSARRHVAQTPPAPTGGDRVGAEQQRLGEADEQGVPWRRWGPYVSARQWGTVREDYSASGDAWSYVSHDQARSRAYRWGEDGIAGVCDDRQILCLALAMWNGQDPILKERLFGLTNGEGNHGEDVKEYYFHIYSTPTHSYMKYLYKYPQAAYPYDDLVATNGRRSRHEFEYELLDTGIFRDDRYFDVFVEYAKAGAEDILIKITAHNRGPDAAELQLLPTLWFRNDWSPWIAASNRA